MLPITWNGFTRSVQFAGIDRPCAMTGAFRAVAVVNVRAIADRRRNMAILERGASSWNSRVRPTEYCSKTSKTLAHDLPAAGRPFGRAPARAHRRRRRAGVRPAVP